MKNDVYQATCTAGAHDVVQGHVEIAQLVRGHAKECSHCLRTQSKPSACRSSSQTVHDGPIRETNCDRAAEAHDYVGTAVGHDAVLELGDDPLFPQAHDHTAPRKRRRPLAVDVRSVQDISQFARETGRMALRNGSVTLAVPDLEAARPSFNLGHAHRRGDAGYEALSRRLQYRLRGGRDGTTPGSGGRWSLRRTRVVSGR
jgi:hypothetical protein